MLIDDDPFEWQALSRALKSAGVAASLECARDMAEAGKALAQQPFDVVFLDDRLDGEPSFVRNAEALAAAGYGGAPVFFSCHPPPIDGIARDTPRLVKGDEARPAMLRAVLAAAAAAR